MSQPPFGPREEHSPWPQLPVHQQGYGTPRVPSGPYPQSSAGYPEPQGYVGHNYPLPSSHYPSAFPGSYPGHAPFGVDPYTGIPYSDKSKLVAGLLGIFLGVFGVGRFYTGHVGLGVAQILVTWCTFGLGAIWPLIDGIMVLAGQSRDVHGRPLRP